METDIANLAVSLARSGGAEYAEARLQSSWRSAALLRNGVLEPAEMSDSHGLGIRVIYNGALAFGASNDLGRKNVRALVERTLKRAKTSAPLVSSKIRLSEEASSRGRWAAEERKPLESVGMEQLVDTLREVDLLIAPGARGVTFPRRLLTIAIVVQDKYFTNSEGSSLTGRVPRAHFFGLVTADYEGKATAVTIPPGYAQVGGSGGWEVIEALNLHEYVKEEIDSISDVLVHSESPPQEDVDVVLGPDVTGLVAHESCGHPGEADRILGREGAQAGESYLDSTDMGRRIGSAEANVVDDPTIPHSMGFYIYDDEGVLARPRRLIEGGVVKELLHNRATAYEFGVQSNGSARSVRFDREPIVRMANTYVEPGDHSFEELIEGISLGVYIKSFMEWNIDDKRLNQRYGGLEAYLIRNGEVGHPVRNPILEITTPKLWSTLDARGKDLKFMAATCGKGDPSQGAPVWTGGPHVRLRNLRLKTR